MEEEERNMNKAVNLQRQESAWTGGGGGASFTTDEPWVRTRNRTGTGTLETPSFRGNYSLRSGPECNNSVFLFTSAERAHVFLCCKRVKTWKGWNTTSNRCWQTLTFASFLSFFFITARRRSTDTAMRTNMTQGEERRDMAAERRRAAGERPQAACAHATLSNLREESRRRLYNSPFV